MINHNEIKKGDIYYATLDPIIGSEQDGKRPVVVVQNNLANKYSPTVIIAPITTVLKKIDLPTHIPIKKNNFLKKDSIILIEQVRVIDKVRLKSFLGRLSDLQVQQVDKALIKALSIDCIKYLYNLEKEDKNVKNI